MRHVVCTVGAECGGNANFKMAPWPEPETEPKAPDKTASNAEKPCETPAVGMKSEKDCAEASGACKPVSVFSSETSLSLYLHSMSP